MKTNVTFNFAGVFYLKILIIGMAIWIGLNLILGNGPIAGQYYVPFFLFFILLFQYSYQLNIRKEGVYIKRLGMGAKVNFNDLENTKQEGKKLIFYMSDTAQHHIPFSRFSSQDQAKILQMIEAFSSKEQGGIPSQEECGKESQEDEIPEHMLKETAKRWINDLLNSGLSKKDVFDRLRDRGVPENKLAKLIASTPDEILCVLQAGKNNIFITIFMLMSAIALWGSYITTEPRYQVYVVVSGVLINGLFLLGFFRFKLIAYNFYILLSTISIVRELNSFFVTEAIYHLIGVVITLCLIAFVWFIRVQLYPDYRWIGCKKDKEGEYIFSD